MKTKKILVVVLALAISVPCFAKKIYLKKEKNNKSFLRSVELVTMIDADYKEGSKTLSLTFYESLGYAIVSVTNSQGQVVYSDYIDTRSFSQMLIPMRDCSSGTYDLTIMPVGGISMEGEFYVN